MRKRTIIAMTALILLAAGASEAAGKEARARFKEEVWDFGKVKQGDVLAHEFVFTNEGDAPLVIGRVSTSCGCTAALASEDRIAPGKEGRIKASFNTRGFAGNVVKYVYVESNDASKARRELKLSAAIDVPPQPRIELDRYTADLGLSLEGEETSTVFTVRNVGELELKIEIAHPDFKFFAGGKSAVFPMSVAAGKEVALEVRFPAPAKPGMLRDYVLIKSNDPVRASLSIYIGRYVVTKKDLKSLFDKYKKELE
ncbi:MAG TPA: DUF1573 domain-containing protein [Acidobacteriota bacterium]|nr:DUF1573 domain-containing protein [Acidobacteriota bacterium]